MAWPFSAGETVLIITTLGGVIVSIMGARHVKDVKAQQNVIEQKVDVVHGATNSRLQGIESELAQTRLELAHALHALRTAETVRAGLTHEAARDVAH